ncbi:hypothetical protein XCCB100_3113 [Xanthomonas campestris pv. campestris]|uniref:Uncharacterized protein n=1 Tax=Xanthomonas campestris pv. campestris (strain B100) TaxID=509169 RepID=B0RXB2_XANCB|nr:hypothetical protein XCCB100_3113 [Xanthomonas campestris pv. campestris]
MQTLGLPNNKNIYVIHSGRTFVSDCRRSKGFIAPPIAFRGVIIILFKKSVLSESAYILT